MFKMCQGHGLKYLLSAGGQQARPNTETPALPASAAWEMAPKPFLARNVGCVATDHTIPEAKQRWMPKHHDLDDRYKDWNDTLQSVLIFLSYHFGQKVSTTSIFENVRTTESRQTNKPINYHQLINSMTAWPPNVPTNCCLHGVLWILIAPEEGFPQSLHVLCLVLHALALEAQLCRQSFANCLHRLAAPETTIRRSSYSRDGHKFEHGQSMSISINFFWRLATFCPSGQDQLPSKSIGPWLSPASTVEILSPVHPRHNCHRFLWLQYEPAVTKQ